MLILDKFTPILNSCCTATTGKIFQTAKNLGFRVYGSGNRIGSRFAYRKGKLPTSPMIVCHADTVVSRGNGPHAFAYDIKTKRAQSIALDDRLGIACMFYGIKSKSFLRDCAMLICDDEETGQSSARKFALEVTPNFLVELDRRGTDVVCYEYDTPILRSLLKSVGYSIGSGSFSDICYLDGYGVAGFNVGIGYHREHSTECYANLADTFDQLARLQKFIQQFGHIRLEHDPYFCDDYRYYGLPKKSYQGYDDYPAKVSTNALDDNYDDFGLGSNGYYSKKDWGRRIGF